MKQIDTYLREIQETMEQIPGDRIEEVISVLHHARVNHKQVFILGNGGSTSTAANFVYDLAKNSRTSGWPGFRVIGLTDPIAMVSIHENEEAYQNALVQQFMNLLQPEDVVIAVTASGNSSFLIEAINYANKHGATTIGFTGLTGGKIKYLAQVVVYVPSNQHDLVEDIHRMLEHVICRSLMEMEEPPAKQREVPSLESRSDETDVLVQELFGKSLTFSEKTGSLTDNGANADLLHKISQELASKLELHDLLARVLSMTLDHIGAVGGSIVMLDEEGEVIEGALAYGGKIQQQSYDRLNDTVHHGLAGWVLKNRKPVLVENTKEDPRWIPRGWEATLDLSRSAICVPLQTQDRVFGVLTLTRLQSNRFTLEDLSLLTSTTLALSYSFTDKASSLKSSQ